MVGIAQLVEHLVVVQGAAGSSPVTHPSAERGDKANREQAIYSYTVRETTEGERRAFRRQNREQAILCDTVRETTPVPSDFRKPKAARKQKDLPQGGLLL